MFQKILAVLFLVGLTSCAELTKNLLKDPEVKITNVEVSNVSLKDISLNLKMSVTNPNAIPLSLGKINYSLQFSGKKVTEGVFEKGIEIPASGTGEVVVPLKFEFNSVGSLIEGFMKKTLTKDYELNGSAQFGILTIPFTKKGEIKIEK